MTTIDAGSHQKNLPTHETRFFHEGASVRMLYGGAIRWANLGDT